MTSAARCGSSVDRERAPASTVTGLRLLVGLALIVLLSGAGSALTIVVVRRADPAWQTTIDFTVLLTAEVYLLALIGLLIAAGGPAGVRDRLAFRYTGRGDLLLALGTWALTVAFGGLVYLSLSPAIGPLSSTFIEILHLDTDVSRVAGVDGVGLGLIAMRAPLVAPLVEELLFRGALYGWMRRRLSVWPTILLSSALFAALQVAVTRSLVTAPWVIVATLAVTWVRSRTGSTLNSFVMHAVNNSTMLIVASVLAARHLAM